MRISSVDTYTLAVPLPYPISLEAKEHRLVVAEIKTDEGVSGLGYTLCFGGMAADVIRLYLETRLKPRLLGADPENIGALWEKMFRADQNVRKVGIGGYALSVLDIALWDLNGKIKGLSLYKLWGGKNNKVPAYGSGGWPKYSVKEIIEEAERYGEKGCEFYKFKLGSKDFSENRQRLEEVAKILGGRFKLMADVNQRFSVEENIEQARLLDDFNLFWYEEPVLADDFPACEKVAKNIKIPVATGENNYTRYEFKELIDREAAKFLMPNVTRANGFSEVARIAQMAATAGIQITPHLVHELSIQLMGAIPNGFAVEFVDWIPDDLFENQPRCADGRFTIPETPGHGLKFTPTALEKYSVS